MKHGILSTVSLVGIGAWLVGLSAVQAQSVLYVDDTATGANDGTSWCAAFVYLQDALAAAEASGGAATEIRVARGIYKPDRDKANPDGTRDRGATFQLLNGVALVGGYAGCGAPDPDERDITAYGTILSGDLNDDDGPARVEEFAPCFSGTDVPAETGCEGFDLDEDGDIDGDDFGVFTNANNYGDNSYHVVTANGTDGTAVLDGFTITAGNANGPTEDNHDKGGGMLNNGGSPTLSKCKFEGNSAEDDAGGTYNSSSSAPTLTECNFNGNYAGDAGGGMKNESSSPELSICTFTGNAAGHGGGLYNRDGSSPTLTGCTFAANAADHHGGGMRNFSGSNLTLTNCTFNGNSANQNGGGMANNADSNLSLTNCTFATNSAGWGGGMHNNSSNPTLTDCTFSDNAAVHDGGGIHNTWESSPALTDCAFSANATSASGGGMFNWQSTPSLTRCTFTENSAAWGGGGMCNGDSRSPTLTECTFTGNSAGGGGGIENFANSTPSLSSCTFNGNSAISAGGGMNNSESSPALTVCTFTENSAENGGGLNNSQSSPTLTGCTFQRNTAAFAGGGLSNGVDSNAKLTRCRFINNSAMYWGGGMNNYESTPILSSCTLIGNTAHEGGGGMHNNTSNPTLTGCTFAVNSASWGGGVQNDRSRPTVANCILWGNSDTDGEGAFSQIRGGAPVVRYSCVQDDDPHDDFIYPGVGNIDDDPLFVDADGPDDIVGTEDDDVHLVSVSPCINAGSNYAPELPEEDMDGDPRIQNCRVDMGGDESSYLPAVTEDCNTNGEDDDCDVYNHDSKDANRDHVPDECEGDCNENGFPDFLDLLFGSSEDCNVNEVPDECEPDDDCNNNGIQDICDVAGGGNVTVFAAGLAGPEDIVPSRGEYPDGYLVTGFSDGVVYHVSPLGGSVTEFAVGLSWPVGARMLPPQFSGQGDTLAVVNEAGTDIVLVDDRGKVQGFAELPVPYVPGIEYVPFEIGGRAAGKLVVTGYDSVGRGRVFTVDNGCVSEVVADLPGTGWTPTLAPADFGDFGQHIFIGDAGGPNIYVLNLETLQIAKFAEAPFDENLRGLRQLAFSRPGWGSALDPTLGEERLLLISVAHRLVPDDIAGEGAIMAWDPEGRLVAIMRKGPDGQSFEPRGLTFVADDLLISDMTQGRDALLLATIVDFRLLDCNDNGMPDLCEIESCPPDDLHCRDCNGNGVPDGCERDCNENGIPDECDIENRTSEDCNRNWRPDECEEGGTEDCDRNGVFDLCDLFSGGKADCNTNGVPDQCDVNSGASEDCNTNGMPDECENDCNGNGTPDECDIFRGLSEDCQSVGQPGYGVPDECDVNAFGSAGSWTTYAPAYHGMCNNQSGYYGAAFDGRYVYFAPFLDGTTYHGRVLRYDTQGLFEDLDSWGMFDAVNNGSVEARGGYTGAVFDGRHVYFVPYLDNEDWHGEVLRYDTQAAFRQPTSWAVFDYGESAACTSDPDCNDPDGYGDGVFDGQYVYFVPVYNGSEAHAEVLRYDTSSGFLSPEAWTTFDPGEHGIGSGIYGWHGAIFDGRHLYFAPAHTGTDWHGEVLRYDTKEDFTSTSSWSACDPGDLGIGDDPDGYYGGVFDDRYVYFVPYHNGTDWHGEVLRHDTWHDVEQDFCDPSFWRAFDPGENGVGNDADGYVRGVFDGRYAYFVPFSNGTEPHSEVLRYDTTAPFDEPSSWATYDYGEDPMGCAPKSTCIDPDGFAGAVYDGEFIYFVPHHNGSQYHGEVLRYDTRANVSADCNETVVPDECEAIGDDDFDANEDVDLFDFEALVDCMAGPGKGPAPFVEECEGACLNAFDMDADLDIDLVDFRTFQRAFDGAP